MTLEQALDRVIRDVQSGLNGLQTNLWHLAMLEDQAIDDDEDFKAAVTIEDNVVDSVMMLGELLAELPAIAADIRGSCPASSQLWYQTHRATRKEGRKQAKEQAKMEAASARA